MKNIFEQLTDLLKKDERLVSRDGVLLKNQTQELARKNDPELIKLLLSDKETKQHFFFEVEKTLIFDKEKFIRFISNKQFLPDSYTAFKNKVGLTAGDKYLSESKEVVLAWPYKDCVLEGGMTKEDQKRDEIFYNETLAPDDINRLLDAKVFTNFKRIDKKGEHKLDGFNRDEKGIIKDNLIIKGNNLLALASLKKEFAGKVKLIYIDPPYNTGGSGDTFYYNNTFKHSAWYVFIQNRLEIAKSLLKDDGFIAIAIDHFELYYLGIIADEIFGRENKIGIVSVVHKPEGRNQEKFFATSNEFMLVYAKNKTIANFNTVVLSEDKIGEFNKSDEKGLYKLNNFLRSGGGDDNLRKNKPTFYYPIYVSNNLSKISLETFPGANIIYPITNSGQERTWKTKSNTFKKLLEDGYIVAQKEKNGIQIFEKYYAEEKGQLIKTHWIDKRYNAINQGTKIVEDLLGSKEFSYPKSVFLVQDVVKLMSDKDGIVLDFFAGSGTTAQAVLDQNKKDNGTRKFIICEQLDYIETVTTKRIKKVIENNGEGEFVYMELARWNEEWIEKIEKAKTEKELIKLWGEMKETAFLSYKVDPKSIDANVKDFADLSLANQKKFLIECLDKNQLYINLSEVDDTEYGLKKDDKALNADFYLKGKK